MDGARINPDLKPEEVDEVFNRIINQKPMSEIAIIDETVPKQENVSEFWIEAISQTLDAIATPRENSRKSFELSELGQILVNERTFASWDKNWEAVKNITK